MPAPTEGPSIVSKFVTLDYTSKICRQAYLPGKHYAVPNWPNVTDVNARGDYGLEAHRLAYIDGSADPWRTMVGGAIVLCICGGGDRIPERRLMPSFERRTEGSCG